MKLTTGRKIVGFKQYLSPDDAPNIGEICLLGDKLLLHLLYKDISIDQLIGSNIMKPPNDFIETNCFGVTSIFWYLLMKVSSSLSFL